MSASGVRAGELVVDVGAGSGALTIELARAGARVWAVEPDPVWCDRLADALATQRLDHLVRVIPTTIERLRLPRVPYRVVANPPFGITTALLALLLDDPVRGPERADLVVQREVAVRHATVPPVALRTAAWAPWWEFAAGPTIGPDAFRPRPSVAASVLTVTRRDPPLLPPRLAPGFVETLRPAWNRSSSPPAVRGSAP